MHFVFGSQLSHRLLFFEHLLDDLGFKRCRILFPLLFLHGPVYTLQTNQFVSEIVGSLYFEMALFLPTILLVYTCFYKRNVNENLAHKY
jgi:hypothetical protein